MGSADPEEGSREPGPALCVTFDPWGSRLAVGHHGGVCAVHGTPWGEGGPPLTPMTPLSPTVPNSPNDPLEPHCPQ